MERVDPCRDYALQTRSFLRADKKKNTTPRVDARRRHYSAQIVFVQGFRKRRRNLEKIINSRFVQRVF